MRVPVSMQAASVIGSALFAGVSFAGCGEEAAVRNDLPRGGRSEAVVVARQDPRQRYCDASATPRALQLPQLSGPPVPTTGYRWINLWATWCSPCIEEMPRIQSFVERLARDGVVVTPYFVSVDGTDELVQTFRSAHPNTPVSARLPDAANIPQLIASLGLDPGAGIPIHAFVNPAGQIVCVRTGQVHEQDYATILEILGGRARN